MEQHTLRNFIFLHGFFGIFNSGERLKERLATARPFTPQEGTTTGKSRGISFKRIRSKKGGERREREVDRARAQDLRAYELAQDRMHLESYAQEITNDARHGNLRRKKNQRLLKQSWEQQVKMRQVRAIVQNT